jgi:plasmid stabilization system protein ParE
VFETFEDIQVWNVRAIPAAQDDFLELIEFYREHGGDISAVRFEEATETLLSTLKTWPRANAKWKDDDTLRRLNFPNHKVSIIYKIEDDDLDVIAIVAFHMLSNPKTTTNLINKRTNELIAEKNKSNCILA